MDLSVLGQYKQLLPYFFWAFGISFLLSPIMGLLAKNFGIVDLPAKLRTATDRSIHKVLHDRIVPKSGGLAIVPAFLIVIALFLPSQLHMLSGMMIGVGIIFIVGVLDDKFDLSGKTQLLGHFLAALAFVLSGSSFSQIGGELFPQINLSLYTLELFKIGDTMLKLNLPSDLITIAWIMIVINAIAWIDALDGLQTGICIIIASTIGVVSLASGNYIVTVLCIIFIGSLLGFLPFNFLPGKAFNGTAGSHVFGYILAILAILGDTKSASSILVLMIPLLDMLWVLVGRIHRNQEVNPFKLLAISDKTHLHHRFLSLGLSKFQVIITEYLFIGIFAIITIASTGSNRITLLLLVAFLGVAFLLTVSIILRVKSRNEKKKLEERKPDEGIPSNGNQSPEQKYAY